MQSNLSDILGGINNLPDDTNTISIVGGYNKYLNPYESKMIVGDTVKTFVKTVNIEWDSFKKTYYSNGKLEDHYYDKLLETVNNIFPLPFSTDNDKEIMYMIHTIYESSPDKICNSIEKHLNLLNPVKKTIKYLFMIWKLYIEKLIELFVNLREMVINKNNPKHHKNVFNTLVDKWSDIDAENRIDTSSLILFFNFPPKNINLEKTIPKINWNIQNHPIDKKINKFLDTIKQSEFEYLGFCPHIIIKRFKILLLFPTSDLLNIINELKKIIENKSGNCKSTNLCKQICSQSSPVIKKFNELSKDICGIRSMCKLKIKKQKLCSISSFPNNVDKKIKCYEKYVNAYIMLYQQLLPHLIKKEKSVCKISILITVISNDIQKIINLIDKMIIY